MINGKNIIAVCTSRIYDNQLHTFLEELNKFLLKYNCRVMIYALNCDLYWREEEVPETYVFDIIPYDRLECLILMDEKIKSRTVSERIISKASACSVPVIVIDGTYDGTVSVSYDYEGGFENIVRHVIEGHSVKNPHFVAGQKNNKFSDARIDIFRKVLADNGMPFDESMISYGEFWSDPARAAAQKIIESENIPDAVICANDIMAINVSDVFVKAGIKVPEQVIVTGFDGLEESLLANPAISTAGCDSKELAEAVGKNVAALLAGETITNTYVLPKLLANASCGCEYIPPESNASLDGINNVYYRYQDNAREFHDISSGMQQSSSPEQAASFLNSSILIHNMCCIVDSGCFESRENYFLKAGKESRLCVFYDSYRPERCNTPFMADEFIPDIERRFSTGYPLIFNALDYMSKPFGYICFSFDSYHITEYTKTASITNSVSMGLGGYVNIQYQRYLTEKMTEELNIAAQMQLNMLPGNSARNKRYEIYASMIPAKSVGGDFYDFFCTDSNHLVLVIADVSGKGVPAALFMATSKMIIHERALMPGTPAEILNDVNRHICGNNKMGLFITLLFGILDLNTGIITYANAGHEYPAVKLYGDEDFTVIESDNLPPVGTSEDILYEDMKIDMSKGGSLFLYTDGVTDVKNADGAHFGLDRTICLLNKFSSCSPEEIINGVSGGLADFSGISERFDDTTMLSMYFHGV